MKPIFVVVVFEFSLSPNSHILLLFFDRPAHWCHAVGAAVRAAVGAADRYALLSFSLPLCFFFREPMLVIALGAVEFIIFAVCLCV